MPRFIYAESLSFDPYFNLGFEKYLFENVRDDELVFFIWQNERTVVCGRNQNVFKECNITSLTKLGGKLARRETGGGAVFHDHGNLNFTFVARDTCFDVDRQLKVIENAVRQFGLPATRTGRNDIAILDKKFSGNAFHKLNEQNLHHGTIMINLDSLILESVLNVSREKLESNGVDSVTSRTINLNELTSDITVESMRIALKDSFLQTYEIENFNDSLIVGGKSLISATGRSGWTPSGSLLAMLQSLAINQSHFQDEDWIFGTKIAFTNEFQKKFTWGEINFQFNVKGNRIRDAHVFSDSLYPEFITKLESELPGHKYDYDDLSTLVNTVGLSFDETVNSICEDINSLLFESI